MVIVDQVGFVLTDNFDVKDDPLSASGSLAACDNRLLNQPKANAQGFSPSGLCVSLTIRCVQSYMYRHIAECYCGALWVQLLGTPGQCDGERTYEGT